MEDGRPARPAVQEARPPLPAVLFLEQWTFLKFQNDLRLSESRRLVGWLQNTLGGDPAGLADFGSDFH